MKLGIQIPNPLRKQEGHVPIDNTRRFYHTYVLGKSGYGKSTALERWAIDDIQSGEGVIFFDVHGDSTDTILDRIPPERWQDTILFDVSDRDFPIPFNPLHGIPKDKRPYVASALLDAVKGMWQFDGPTPNIDLFTYAINASLLDVPDATMLGGYYLLSSDAYRKKVLSHLKDPFLKTFWRNFFEELPSKEQRAITMSTFNKSVILFSDPTIRNILGQTKNALDLTDIMEQGRVLLVRLPIGQIGIEKVRLIGQFLLSRIHLTAMERKSRTPIHLYLDESQHFAGRALKDMLAEIRKFKVSLILANQYLDQHTPEMQAAILGTVSTFVAYRLSPADAGCLEPEFKLREDDTYGFTDLPPYTAYARAEGLPIQMTRLLEMPAHEAPSHPGAPDAVRTRSRALATQRKHAEAAIRRFIEGA